MRSKSILVAIVVFLITGNAHATLTGGLVAHWKLDGDATDSASNNDGTVFGGASWSTGKVDGALDFDGIDDYIQIDDNPDLDGMGEFTLTSWVKTDGTDTMFIINKATHNTGDLVDDAYAFGIHSTGQIRFQYTFANVSVMKLSNVTVADNSWHHLAVTYTGSDGFIYLDGVAVSLARDDFDPGGPINNSPEPVLIGCATDATGLVAFFDGSIDDVRIYNRALSSAEVSELYSIPEPATLLLLGLGGLILRKRKQ